MKVEGSLVVEKELDVSALCRLSKLNIDDEARIEAELREFADFAAVLDTFAAHNMSIEAASESELRADTKKNQASELSGSYVTVPLTVRGAQDV